MQIAVSGCKKTNAPTKHLRVGIKLQEDHKKTTRRRSNGRCNSDRWKGRRNSEISGTLFRPQPVAQCHRQNRKTLRTARTIALVCDVEYSRFTLGASPVFRTAKYAPRNRRGCDIQIHRTRRANMVVRGIDQMISFPNEEVQHEEKR